MYFPTFTRFISDSFEFGGSIAAGYTARALLGSLSPASAALGAPIVILADRLAQAIVAKIASLPCFSNIHGTMQTYGFMIAKPLTFAFTVLLALGVSAIAGVSYPLSVVILTSLILTTGLFMAQVSFKILYDVVVPCLNCCRRPPVHGNRA